MDGRVMPRSSRVAPMIDEINSVLNIPEDGHAELDNLAFELASLDSQQSRAVSPSVVSVQPGRHPPMQAWATPPVSRSPSPSPLMMHPISQQPTPSSAGSEVEGRVRGIFCLSQEGCGIFREVLGIYPGCADMLRGITGATLNLSTLERILGSFEGMLSSPFNYDGSMGQSSRMSSGAVGAVSGLGMQLTVSSLLSCVQSRRSDRPEDSFSRLLAAQVPEIITGMVSGFVTGVVSYVLENSATLNLSPGRAFMYSGFVGVITFFVFRILLRLLLNHSATARHYRMGGNWGDLFRDSALFNISEVLLTLTVVVVVSSLAVTAPIATVGTALKVAGCEIAFHSLFSVILEANVACFQQAYCCSADRGCYVSYQTCIDYLKRWTGIGQQAGNYGFCAALLECVTKLQSEAGAEGDAVRPF